MKLAFIGIGNVGFALANNLQQKGYSVCIGHEDPNSNSVKKAVVQNPNFTVRSPQKAIDQADAVFLATPFKANETILKNLDFGGKPLVDCTNPVGPGISHGLESTVSGAEKVQQWAPTASVVKAFTIYGFENFSNPSFPISPKKPVMLFAGNDSKAKSKISTLIGAVGFFPKDVGGLDQALHLEHMTLLWVKMVRRDGHHPHFAWAYLERD